MKYVLWGCILALPVLSFADFRIYNAGKFTRVVIFSTAPTATQKAKIKMVRCVFAADTNFDRNCKAMPNRTPDALEMDVDDFERKALAERHSLKLTSEDIEEMVGKILDEAAVAKAPQGQPHTTQDVLSRIALATFGTLEGNFIFHKIEKDRLIQEEAERLAAIEAKKKFDARPVNVTATAIVKFMAKWPQEMGGGGSWTKRTLKGEGLNLPRAQAEVEALKKCEQALENYIFILHRKYNYEVLQKCKIMP